MANTPSVSTPTGPQATMQQPGGMFQQPFVQLGIQAMSNAPAYWHQDIHGPISIGEMDQSISAMIPRLPGPLNPKALADIAAALTPPTVFTIFPNPRANWQRDY